MHEIEFKEVLKIHKDWIKSGFSMQDILEIIEKIKYDDPLVPISILDIKKYINDTYNILTSKDSDLDKDITFLIITDCKIVGGLDFSQCGNLEEIYFLSVSNPQLINFKPLINNHKLKSIEILNCGLQDLEGIEHLVYLEHLDISDNRVSVLKGFDNLSNVSYLNISGNLVEDLSSVAKLTALKEFKYVDATSYIEDISALLHLKNLEKIYIRDGLEQQVYELATNLPECSITFEKEMEQICYDIHRYKSNSIDVVVGIVTFTESMSLKVCLRIIDGAGLKIRNQRITDKDLKDLMIPISKTQAKKALPKNRWLTVDKELSFKNENILVATYRTEYQR
jgi:hypothetical protein